MIFALCLFSIAIDGPLNMKLIAVNIADMKAHQFAGAQPGDHCKPIGINLIIKNTLTTHKTCIHTKKGLKLFRLKNFLFLLLSAGTYLQTSRTRSVKSLIRHHLTNCCSVLRRSRSVFRLSGSLGGRVGCGCKHPFCAERFRTRCRCPSFRQRNFQVPADRQDIVSAELSSLLQCTGANTFFFL